MRYFSPFYDPTMILLIPALIFSFYAQSKIQTTFNRFLKVKTHSGITGSEAARRILDINGLWNVPVEPIRGNLTDHYDPSKKVLRLSENVFYGSSIASVGVAAHEAGHAIQHEKSYAPLLIRNSLVPVANIGSNLSWILIILGFALGFGNLVNLGIWLFSAVVLFSIITLPVEFNASSRAIGQLEGNGLLYGDELRGARKVLSAAALTYVASTLVAVSQLLRLIFISRNRRD